MTYCRMVFIIVFIIVFWIVYKRKDLRIFWALVIIIIYLLFWTILSLESSPFYYLSNIFSNYPSLDLSKKATDTWAIRGQIGDILAGHFSALAFIAIAMSIYLQSEANKQIKNSLKTQDKALKAQIVELKDSREESSKQTEEFFISNMNVKLDRYYKILDKNLELVTESFVDGYVRDIKILNKSSNTNVNYSKISKKVKKEATQIRSIVMALNFIYSEIIKIEKTSPSAYQTYIEELRLRLYLNEVFHIIHTSIDEYKKTPVFDLYKNPNEPNI